MAKKHHKFSHTTVEHHKDGSHTVTHHHESGKPEDDVKGAVGDHDSMMDHMMTHTAPPSADMASADAGQHGIPPEAASAAGIPAPSGAPAPAPAAGV